MIKRNQRNKNLQITSTIGTIEAVYEIINCKLAYSGALIPTV
jgi:hypothetical protein